MREWARLYLKGAVLATATAVGVAMLPACSHPVDPPPDSGTTWAASSDSAKLFGIEAWSLRVPAGSTTVELTGMRSDGTVAIRSTLEWFPATAEGPARHVLTLPEGRIEFRADGTVGENTLPATQAAQWDKILLSSILDRVASNDSAEAAGGLVASQSAAFDLHPRVTPGIVGSAALVQNGQRLSADCAGAQGEAAYWTASQGALACTGTGGDPRSLNSGAPYGAALVKAANFDTSTSGCAGSGQALASMQDAVARPCDGGSVKLVSFGTQLLHQLCLAGVAAATAAAGGVTYWVCDAGAAIVAGGACTLALPGGGTVACGAAAATGAAPACAAGGAAVAAGTAAAALPLCASSSTGPDCPPEDLRRLSASKDEACNNLSNSCTEAVRQSGGGAAICISLSGRRQGFTQCRQARQDVVDQCFGGKPTDEGHADQLTTMQRLMDDCDRLISQICPTT